LLSTAVFPLKSKLAGIPVVVSGIELVIIDKASLLLLIVTFLVVHDNDALFPYSKDKLIYSYL
jgi:hypothetical protein